MRDRHSPTSSASPHSRPRDATQNPQGKPAMASALPGHCAQPGSLSPAHSQAHTTNTNSTTLCQNDKTSGRAQRIGIDAQWVGDSDAFHCGTFFGMGTGAVKEWGGTRMGSGRHGADVVEVARFKSRQPSKHAWWSLSTR